MESAKVALNHWPQVLVATVFVVLIWFSVARHGKPLSNPNVDAKQTIWAIAWYALVLGMGGFWG